MNEIVNLAEFLNPDQNAKLYRLLQTFKGVNIDETDWLLDRALSAIECVEVNNSGAEDWAKLLG